MRRHIAQYVNEIVSITIMMLMAIALVAGRSAPVSMAADDGSDPLTYQSVRAVGDE